MLKQYHYTSLSYKNTYYKMDTRWSVGVFRGGCGIQSASSYFYAHLHISTRIFIFLRASSIFYAHLHFLRASSIFYAHLRIFYAHLRFSTRIFDFLRASSIFYAHLQHDQDFPSDTRPRDDPASRLAPGHALVTPPFGLTVATPVAGPLQSCLSSRLPPPSDLLHLCVSSWVIRYISWKHRVPYFPFDPWGIVTIIQ